MRMDDDLLTIEFLIVVNYQYWMPGLGSADKRKKPKFELEYLTYTLPSLRLENGDNDDDDDDDDEGKKEPGLENGEKGKKEGWYPVPLKELPKSLRKGKKSKKYLPYEMEDLTIGSWLKIALKLGDVKQSKLRKKFERYMYMGGEEE